MVTAVSRSKKASRRNMLIAFGAALVVATAGYVLVLTKAAGFFASVNAGSANLSGNATFVTENDGSKSVRFNAPATPPPPSGSTSCPLPKYPDESCTGVPAGTVLTKHTGNMSINTPNTVIEGKDIRGCVEVHAPGVVIRKSKVNCPSFGVILSHTDYSGPGVLIEDSQISCLQYDANGDPDPNKPTSGTGVGDNNFTVRRSNIFGCENGFDVDKNVTIEDSYIHNLASVGADPHTDGIQITPVGENVTIRHNRIYAYNPIDGKHGTSNIISPKVSSGILKNILIQDNLFAGGAYALYCQQEGKGDDYRVVNNHFSTIFSPKVAAFGPWVDCEDETVSGNVYHETGLPVPF